ncbi:MAG TPA: NUDIX hydrolase [Dehalococcoidia bacterium]|nr:NUDIX hydrolase [Dehalococcoidia bacterium]
MTSEQRYPILVGTLPIYKGRVINLRVDEIEFPTGIVRREVVEHGGAVVIVPVDAEGRILWIRQHRWAAQRELLELPAGTLEKGETPEATARRELPEETGFAAATWVSLGGFYSAPGFCEEYLYAFAASDLTPEEAQGDDDEDISVEPLTLDETFARIDAGLVEDAKSLAALMLYLRRKQFLPR